MSLHLSLPFSPVHTHKNTHAHMHTHNTHTYTHTDTHTHTSSNELFEAACRKRGLLWPQKVQVEPVSQFNVVAQLHRVTLLLRGDVDQKATAQNINNRHIPQVLQTRGAFRGGGHRETFTPCYIIAHPHGHSLRFICYYYCIGWACPPYFLIL